MELTKKRLKCKIDVILLKDILPEKGLVKGAEGVAFINENLIFYGSKKKYMKTSFNNEIHYVEPLYLDFIGLNL